MDIKTQLESYIQSKNIAEDMDEKELTKIGQKVCELFDEDDASRKPWREKMEGWMKLATQVVEKKTYPWPDAANVKFPLLTTAAMQFAARAYPALVPGPKLVQGLVIGRDEAGEKRMASERIGAHMSYQLLFEMKGWEEDMDRLCIMLPIVGCVFKKTYYDPIKGRNCSDLVLPNDLVIDYYAKTVEDATRKTHVIYKTKNQIRERVNEGLYCDIQLPLQQSTSEDRKVTDLIDGMLEPKITDATPYKILECHCWWDFDDDEYDEPYIITVDYLSKKVLRIIPRFTADNIRMNGTDVVSIEPTEYFTKFGFIPNPDGSIYDLGFGLLLGGINETVNTLTNQLLDSGTLNNLQGGFLGRGIRVRGGNTRFIPGEWKPVDFSGDDIKKNIFPMPTKEPSDVLLKLLEILVTSGKEIASVAEIMVGKMPGQNTPATTTMATIEQGLKVFTAIYKRVYRALGNEYEKLFKLNGLYMDEKVYFTINEPSGPQGQEAYKQDYTKSLSVKPNADPNIVSSAQKMLKVQAMGGLLQLGTINPKVYTQRFLEAIDEENISELMNYQPPPSPEQQKAQMEQQKIQADMQGKQADAMIKQQESQQKAELEQMKAALDKQSKEMELRFKVVELQLKQRESEMKLMTQAREHQMNMEMQKQEHSQAMQHNEQQHSVALDQTKQQGEVKIEIQKAQAAAKPKPKGE